VDEGDLGATKRVLAKDPMPFYTACASATGRRVEQAGRMV
jgi:hypothetical protein